MAKKVSARDQINQKMSSFFDTVESSIKDAAKEAASGQKDDPMSKLERMAQDFQEVHLKIEKKQRNGSRYELWCDLTLPVEDVMARGTDVICKEQGGGGQYRVRVRAPGDKQARFAAEHNIAGQPLDQPRSDLEMGFGSLPGIGGMPGSMPGFGNLQGFSSPRSGQGSGNQGSSQDPTKLVEAMSRQFDKTLNSQQSSADRNNQLMMTMLMSMMQNNQQQSQPRQPAEDLETRKQLEKMREELQALERERERERARFERLEQDRKMEALLAARDKELAELKNMYQNHQNKSSEKDWLIPLITTMNNSQGQSTQTMVEIMKMAQQKPSELEMFGNFISTVSTVMNGQFEGQARLLEVVKDSLSGGDDHPIRDAILRGMDGLMNLGSEALQAQAMKAQVQGDDAQVVGNEPPPIGGPDESLQGLPEHEEAPQVEEPEEPEEDEEGAEPELLTDAEFERMERDSALQKAIASILNGDHPSEATARFYRHATVGNNQIAFKWLQWPYDISEQVFTHLLGTTIIAGPKGSEVDLAKALGDDVMDFSQYLDGGGDPWKWAKTGWTPEKKIRPEELDPALRPSHAEEQEQEMTAEPEEKQEVTEPAEPSSDAADSEN